MNTLWRLSDSSYLRLHDDTENRIYAQHASGGLTAVEAAIEACDFLIDLPYERV